MHYRQLKIAALLAVFLSLGALLGLPAQAQGGGVYHLVKHGEDLVVIVDAYMTPRQIIIEANKLKAPYRLQAGDVLFIPEAPRVVDIPTRRRAPQEAKPPLVAARPPLAASQLAAKPVKGKTRTSAAAPVVAARPPLAAPQLAAKPVKGKTRTSTAAPVVVAPPASKAKHKASASPAASAAARPSPRMPAASALPPVPPAAGKGFLMPLNGEIIGKFGKQANGMFYNGIRIAVTGATPVMASESGVAIYVGELKGYGSTVILQHAQDYATVYTNLGSANIKLNGLIQRGKTLGIAPSCARGTNCYISFELRQRNQALDPTGRLVKN